MNDDLAKRSTVRDLVAAFRSAETAVRVTFQMIVGAEERLNNVFTLNGSGHIRIDATYARWSDDFKDPESCIERMSRDAWRCIVDRLELRRIMSVRRWDELTRHLDSGKLPPITEENVWAFARQYGDNFREMMTEAVGEVFDWLRPRSGTYKTNSLLEIGPKVILHCLEPRDKRWSFERHKVSHYSAQNLVAMERVFNGLDGKGEILHTYQSELQTAIEASFPNGGRGETPLFSFKCFENGNLHLEFRRLDLLKKFNMIAGGRTLRPCQEASK